MMMGLVLIHYKKGYHGYVFENKRKEVIEAITNSPSRVSFTSDNWQLDVKSKIIFALLLIILMLNGNCIRGAFGSINCIHHLIWFCISDEVHMCFCNGKLIVKFICMILDNASYNDRMTATIHAHLLSKGALLT